MNRDRERERNEKLNDDATRWIFQTEYPELWAYDDKIVVVSRRDGRTVQDNVINRRADPEKIYLFVTTTGRSYVLHGWAFGSDDTWSRVSFHGPNKWSCHDNKMRNKASLLKAGFQFLGIRVAA